MHRCRADCPCPERVRENEERSEESRSLHQRLAMLEQKLACIGENTTKKDSESGSEDFEQLNYTVDSKQRIEQLESELAATKEEIAFAMRRTD
ncbi:hypothetical protein PENTCL1PPCAC_21932, partial [Pristionchus entomophagus]